VAAGIPSLRAKRRDAGGHFVVILWLLPFTGVRSTTP